MFVNTLRKKSHTLLVFETIPNLLVILLRAGGTLLIYGGLGCVVLWFMTKTMVLPSGVCYSAFPVGFICHTVGSVLAILKQSYTFDCQTRTVHYKGHPKFTKNPDSEKSIPFDDIHHFSLIRVNKQGAKHIYWVFAIHLKNEQRYIVSGFLNEKKARRILQELVQATHIALYEEDQSIQRMKDM